MIAPDGLTGCAGDAVVSAGLLTEVSVPIGICPFTSGFGWVDGFGWLDNVSFEVEGETALGSGFSERPVTLPLAPLRMVPRRVRVVVVLRRVVRLLRSLRCVTPGVWMLVSVFGV